MWERNLAARYGEPTETDASHARLLFDTLDPRCLEGNLTAIDGWTLDDGTRVYLLMLYSDVYTFYFNEARLLQTAAAPAPPAAFVFSGGVTWASTRDDVLAAEGAADAESTAGDYRTLFFDNRQLDGDEAETMYFFKNGKLAITAVYYPADEVKAINLRRMKLMKAYGASAETDLSALAQMVAFLLNDQAARHSLSDVSNWLLADGTRIVLFSLDDTDVYVFYCNGPLVLDTGAAAPQAGAAACVCG